MVKQEAYKWTGAAGVVVTVIMALLGVIIEGRNYVDDRVIVTNERLRALELGVAELGAEIRVLRAELGARGHLVPSED